VHTLVQIKSIYKNIFTWVVYVSFMIKSEYWEEHDEDESRLSVHLRK